MHWATFLLAITSGFVAIKLISLANSHGRLKFLGLTIAAGILTVMQSFAFSNGLLDNSTLAAVTQFIIEWGHVICLAFILSSLAVFIRESKPVFAQFPLLYTAFPLLIVISYLLVKDTYALKKWLLAIYQGGAIIVSLLMYSVYTYKRQEYALVLTGAAIFLVSYLIYWYVPGISASYQWIWKVLVAGAMLTTLYGYENALKGQNHQTN